MSNAVLERLAQTVANLAARLRNLETQEIVAANLPTHPHTSTATGGDYAWADITGFGTEPAAVSSSTSGTAGVATTASRGDHGHDLGSHAHTATTGGAISSDQNIRTTANFAGLTQNIADDAVYSFTPGAQYGLLLIGARAAGIQTSWALLQYRSTDSSNFMGIMVANAVVAVTTGALTGTTGADGAMTVSSHTDGKIYIENRLGGTIGLNIVVLGG